MTRKFLALTALSILAMSSAQTPVAPATVDTSAEKAAWEALMSPVGEYAAYATYDAIVRKYGNVEPYATILRSEQMHINALSRQLQRYGVTVPANPYLGKITLPADLKAIAREEAQTEVDNANLYDRLMPQASGDAQLQRVFTNLRDASRDVHLVLFNKAAAANGTLSAADMTSFHNQNMNSMGMNGQGKRLGQAQNAPGQRLGQAQTAPGQRLGQQKQSRRDQMNQMNPADCPMMNGQGRGPGWRR